MDISTPTVSPLRQRMLDDMRLRKMAEHTQDGYMRAVRKLAAYIGRSPDTASIEELRRFQLHLVDAGTGPVTINATITGLKFFFDITLGRPELLARMQHVRVPRTLPVVLSPEEAARLIAAAPKLKHQAAMSVAYGTGLRVSEIVSLKVSDVDSQRMTLRVEQGKGRQDRYARLSPVLLGHKQLETTFLYAQVATDLLRSVISPLDKPPPQPDSQQVGRGAARPEVADIFREHGPACCEAQRGHLSAAQFKGMSAIVQCRSAALGGHVLRREGCGTDQVSYNSCSRHCPKCQSTAARRWLDARHADLPPVEYCHMVFTLPAPIADLAYQNKAELYGLLFDVAAEVLQTIAAEPKHLGARIGATLVLHTWGSALTHHPHVHAVVPGGGLAPAGKTERVVYAKSPFAGPSAVLAYLSRYTHRVAISNSRLIAMDERGLTFKWKDYRVKDGAKDGAKGKTRHKTMTLAPEAFMRRFLLHVLPGGFHRIRHHGSLANGGRKANLILARELLHAPAPASAEARDDAPGDPVATFVCWQCGRPMVVLQTLTRCQSICAPPPS